MSEQIKKNNYAKWDNFLIELQRKGRYAFTIDDLRRYFDLSEESLLQGLFRYKQKKQIAQIRKGFYAILTPEYSTQGMLPYHLFIDDLMKSLNKPYYVALISASALYGAAHQQPMEYFVIAQTPAPRSINSKKLKISFLSKNSWEKDDIIQKATYAGYINVSSPELTALDLLAYADKIGLNRVTTVLHELAQIIKVSSLSRTIKKYPNTPILQRMGYIMDKVLNENKIAEVLLKNIKDRNVSPIVLSTQKAKNGDMDETWKVMVNMEIESDL
jgi:predicted transcriptional regulator of viral defense system